MHSGLLGLLIMSRDVTFPRLPSPLQAAVSLGIGTLSLARAPPDPGRGSVTVCRMSRQIGAQIRICTENQEIEKLMGIPKASSGLENKDLRTRIK